MSAQPPLTIRRFTSVNSKIRLMWVWKQGSGVGKLSRNVLTEVCSYIARLHLAIIDQCVVVYPTSTRSLRLLYELKSFKSDPYAGHVLIGNNQILVCGGEEDRRTHSRSFLIDRGSAYPLSSMRSPRQSFGIYYILALDCVYVFGGVVNRSFPRDRDDYLKESEKFDLKKMAWVRLPEMIMCRREFNVCECDQMLYLCGGNTPYVEVFNPKSESFSRCPKFYLPEVSPTVTVVHNGHLISLTYSFKTTWSVHAGNKVSFVQRKHWELSADFEPVVIGNSVYLFDERQKLVCVDLVTDEYEELA